MCDLPISYHDFKGYSVNKFLERIYSFSTFNQQPRQVCQKWEGKLSDLFQIESLFEPHMTYIKDQESCTQYARSTYQTNQIFKVFVMVRTLFYRHLGVIYHNERQTVLITGSTDCLQWCESQKMCGRLKLTDLLVKPVQRLAQYPLLLQAILKNSSLKEEQSALKQAVCYLAKFSKIPTQTCFVCCSLMAFKSMACKQTILVWWLPRRIR